MTRLQLVDELAAYGWELAAAVEPRPPATPGRYIASKPGHPQKLAKTPEQLVAAVAAREAHLAGLKGRKQ